MKKPIIFLLLTILYFMFCFNFVSFKFNRTNALSLSNDIPQPEISAKSALLIEYNSGKVIYEKNSNERLPIASMTKLASLSLIFDAINKGAIKENDMVMVSENAAKVGGSSAFLDAGSKYKVADLIKTIVVASANDSTVALAEFVAGSEDVFVSKMNKMAENLGLKDTHFANSTGLPAENHYSTAHDIAIIYKTMCNNKLYKKFSKIWMEDFIHPSGRKTGLVNTNRLVKTFDGIEGGKTGYTDAAKFCLTASASRSSLRLIGVVIGATDSKTRFAEMSKLLNFGFSNYANKLIVNSEVPVTNVKINKSKNSVDIFAENDIYKLIEKTDTSTFKTDFRINEDIKAPLKAGDKVGTIYVLDQNNMVLDEINLIVKTNVECEKWVDSLKKIVNAW